MKKLTKSLALIFALMMCFTMLATALVGCNNGSDDTNTDTNTDTGSTDTNVDSGNTQNPDGTADYSVQVKTIGGMPLANVNITVMLDGNIKDYGVTDTNGTITFNLPASSGYTVSVKNPPAGYTFDDSYSLNEAGTVITTMSSIIENPDNAWPNKAYQKGDIMMDLEVKTVEGETLKLSEILKTKKMVMLNFFFTTCGPCASEAPYMNAAYEIYKDDIEIISISPWPTDDDAKVKTFVYDYGITFPAAKVPSSWAEHFPINGYPTNMVIDRYGMIALVETGGIVSQTPFNIMFDHFTKDDYEQKIVNSLEEITPTETPNVEMPSSDEIGAAINKGDIEIEYFSEDNEMAWPFVIMEDAETGEKFIFNSNSGKMNSFAQINMKVKLKAGEVLAFDYLSNTENTESNADIVYIFADGKDIFQIVGAGGGWKSCYAYVADQDGEYEINILYMKNEVADNDPNDDGIAIKNMRVVNESEIDEPTYISKYAATQKNDDGFGFNKYADLVLDDDGFYRVCQRHEEGHECPKNGPYLLAELIGVTQFAPDTSITIIMYNDVLNEEDSARLLKYCNYASNSQYYGLTVVNEELKNLLIKITDAVGFDDNPNEWLQICEYYSAYGTEKQMANPIMGLTTLAPFEALEGKDNPNVVEYDGRLIMPRGLLYRFVPTKSGAYRINTNSSKEVLGWIFLDEKETLLTDSDKGERLSYIYTDNDYKNCTMVAYLEEGKEYYIDIAYYEIYDSGTFTFTVEYIGESYQYFIVASPGPFTLEESEDFDAATGIGAGPILAGGVDVMLGDDGYYYVKNEDGSQGSKLYADFLFPTNVFPTKNLQDVIMAGGFDLSKTDADQEMLAYISSFEVQYIIDNLKEELDADAFAQLSEDNLLVDIINGKKDTEDTELKGKIEEHRKDYQDNKKIIAIEYFKTMWGADYEEYAELNQLEDVLDGVYHGINKNYTEIAQEYVDKMMKEEDYPDNPELHGCVEVDEELAMILQAIMDKYTFAGVDHSWTKLCYYYCYIGA